MSLKEQGCFVASNVGTIISSGEILSKFCFIGIHKPLVFAYWYQYLYQLNGHPNIQNNQQCSGYTNFGALVTFSFCVQVWPG